MSNPGWSAQESAFEGVPLYNPSFVLVYQPLILTPFRTVASVATRIVVRSAGAGMHFLYTRLGFAGLISGGACTATWGTASWESLSPSSDALLNACLASGG